MSTDLPSIKALIIDTLAARSKTAKPVNGETVIVDDLGLDSLAVMNFVMDIEDRLDVSVPLDRLAGIRTINDLAACLAELTAAP
ncbi:acyl carrier protein [Granulibacter bethesdensis]|uniref:acyl carrier protein n=1 Tax=Granulibacter bethesdensis TaxID=364410 RepID=UPI0003F20D83|nr:acyl carrier protein [Granulibacter bethesdensis]AHJ64614.1 Acyl carrier protein [Granulibacter bethesdensis CGDNIH4]APH58532.1 Acyl carrier protein [Granulibacter bethesdensis]